MLRFMIPLIAVLACGLAASVDECRFGESYWCSSLENAKNCGAMEHCQTTVWKNQLLKQDDTEVCTFCQTIIADVTSLIKDNKTQQEILRFFTNACQMVPSKSVAAECQTLVEDYLTEIINLIINDVTPRSVCSLIKLCTAFEDKVTHSQLPQPKLITKFSPLHVTSEPLCADCKKLFVDLKNMIASNATEQEIETLIDQGLCTYLGTYESECKQLVHEYLPEIITLLASEFDPNLLCQSLGFCTQTIHEAKNFLINLKLKKSDFYKKASSENSAIGCNLCKTVMKDIQNLDRDKAVQSDIENFLKNEICAHLGSFKVECIGMVDIYGPLLFQVLANELDPEARCQSLGFCAYNNEIREPVREATPAKTPVSSKPTHVDNTPQCILCEFVMKELDDMLSKNATKAEIIAALDKVCNVLPSTIKASCDDFVKQYGEAIIEMLIQELDPSVICTAIGLCSGSNKVIPPAIPDNSMRCLVCETAVQYLEALLQENATIALIEKAMEKVCHFLPEKFRTECDLIVTKYGPEIIQYLSMPISPKTVCELAGVCPTLMVKPGDKVLLPEAPEVKETHKRLGDSECTWGPKHWCASRENAKACQATVYCEQNGWEF